MKNNVYALRNNLKLSQAELAKQCGVTQQFIQLLERGKRSPSIKTAEKLAAVLGVTLDELVKAG